MVTLITLIPRSLLATVCTAALVAAPWAQAQSTSATTAPRTKVMIGMSGWTGFGPLTLAKETGLFERHGIDVTIRKIPQKDRHLAIASGDIQCAATSTETWIVWNANGVPMTQIFKMNKGMGADGIVARPGIDTVAQLKGKTIGVSAPGTNPHFSLAWILKKNGMSLRDLKLVTLEPAQAANALIAGNSGLDAAMTYEPYLGAVYNNPGSGKLIADSAQYNMVFDTFGCTPAFLREHPKAARALVDGWFEALARIKQAPQQSFAIMGADVKQTAAQYEASQQKIEFADRAENLRFFTEEIQGFQREAAQLLLETGVIKAIPADLDSLYTTQFLR